MVCNFDRKPPYNQAAGQLLNPHFRILLSQAIYRRYCCSLFHQSKDCEFVPNPTSNSHNLPPYHLPGFQRIICHQWNKQFAHGCSLSNCGYEHIVPLIQHQGIVIIKQCSAQTFLLSCQWLSKNLYHSFLKLNNC